MNPTNSKDDYRTSRILYIIEAALEYFIQTLVTGAYIAKAATVLGMNDSLTGILTSFVSLGSAFQIVALFLANRSSVKRLVTVLHTINQLFFAATYLVPVLNIPKELKTVGFIVMLLGGHILNHIINSPKINWYMSLVDDKKRGGFTSTKEIVSLLSGMLFTYAVSNVIDYCDASGDTTLSLIFCAVTLFALAISHTLTLIFSKEKPNEITEQISVRNAISRTFREKGLWIVIPVSVLWSIANYSVTPFTGTYQIKELAFSMTFISIISAVSSLFRALISRPLGKFADRFDFREMLTICFAITALAFGINVFTRPENGSVLYFIFSLLLAAGNAGINSGEINLIYDYVSPQNRMSAFAVKSALAGVCGFTTTLIMSTLVKTIQNNGNTLFGIPVYAQQVTSLIAFVVAIGIIIYLNTVVKSVKPTKRTNKDDRHDNASESPRNVA